MAFAPAAAADEWIELSEDGFWPSEIQVDAGETLHFSSEDEHPWSVVSDGGLFDSGALTPRGAFSMALSVPGTHVYRTTAGPEHEARITVRPGRLPGGQDDPASPAIPDLAFPPARPDDIRPHPDFGFEVSISRIMVGFRDDATVGEANAALEAAGVRIIGGLPTIGMLLVEPKAASDGEGGWWYRFYEFQEALEVLRASPGIAYAAMSAAVDGSALPRRAEDAVAGRGWDWDDPFAGGNWGLAFADFPQAWNLLEPIRHKRPQAITAVVDEGFEEHADLPALEVQTQTCPPGGECRPLEPRASAHGNHVAGIIGAAYDNAAEGAPGRSRGVSGANPVARMYGYPAPVDAWTDKGLVDQHIELFERILRSRPADLRVINYSMTPTVPDYGDWQDNHGYKSCGPGAADDDLPELQVPMKRICTPNNLDAWQREMAHAGRAAAPIARHASQQGVMIVQAAGNDGVKLCPGGSCQPIHAASRSPFAWVSHHWDDAGVGEQGLPNPMLVVQSLDGTGAKRADSNLGGDIAAPGDAILSTVLGQGYDVMGGTSMAAPYVTGLIGYLLADDPSLTIEEVRRLVLGWGAGRPADGTGADFTWSMPDRTNRDVTGDGMVDYRTDRSEIEPIRWDVDLDACDATVNGKPVGTYRWTVDGEVVGETGECMFRWRPWNEGTYSVTLTATAVGGEQATVTKAVEVDDLLIVSVGDSIASGEGNPDIADPFGPGDARWQLERCHRSAFGGPAQAARWFEAADARTSVTLLHLACSGGRIEGDRDDAGELEPGFAGIGGLLTPYEGVTENSDHGPCALSGRTDLSVCEPPQLDQAKAKVGDREIDALLVSIGANDMWFSSILTNCLIPLNDCSTNEGGRGLFEQRIQLLPDRYARLAARIREQFPDLPAGRVVITQYPDLTTDESGAVDLSCGIASGISAAEQQWAHDTVIPALNAQVAQAAATHGWTLAAGVPEAFLGHGYCSDDPWIVDITGTVWDQADKNGAFHPNYYGHTAYASEIIDSVRDVLGLEHRPPRPLRDTAPRLNAFRAVAGNGPAARVADVN
ncbi:MAG TPA: S8 family serine peptidase, partial [Solirubrobacter sp.]|nr:S8 family serine peptidase [Solirubrobacter sp.]